MAILTAKGLAKYFGAQDIFADLSFEINYGDKIALIGPNGVGKTTLLRILYGIETPTAGDLSKAKDVRIGYLPQEPDFSSQHTLYDEMLEVFQDLLAQRASLQRLEQEMRAAENTGELLERYGKALARFEAAGGYEYEHRIQRILSGLGFNGQDYGKPVDILSGGQKTRAQLAKLLLQDPNLLLLDEPTNHLDLAATEWLEKYLQSWPGSLIVVAHDRYFLDKVVNRVWEMSFGGLEQYRGNYTRYIEQRAERVARRWAEYRQQQEYIAKTEDFVRRYKAGQRAKEARGRQKRLDHLEPLEPPREQKTLRVPLQARFRSGNDVLASRGLVIGYQQPDEVVPGQPSVGRGKVLFSCPDLLVRRLQRVALIGPNGSGKTTFLKTILGQVPPLAGQVRLGSSVKIGYLAQGYEDLDPEKTVLEEILAVKDLPLDQARGFLGRFLFSGDDVFKPIAALSGGERGRVALAKLTLEGANFLLLDEPTNHLDIASQEILEQVLAAFNGTILFVSHDRYFIDALATHIWLIENQSLRVYEGNYSAYIAQKELELQEQASDASFPPKGRGREIEPRGRERQKSKRDQDLRSQQVANLEAAIAELESQLAVLEKDLDEASMAQEVDRIRELGLTYAEVERELYEKLAAWAEIERE